ncbi:helix-turn-helix domain-containing protein [Sphingomonas sp. MMS12-HWE2-04]|uniref:MerR family transcriptional regulator n=1 Tax=Sphingomonas sp. MMS12-HWE2-04 TaxID=3234199 RepID=UPI00384B6BA2
MAQVTIGGLSTATGVKIETIRYYERAGLISPPLRTGGNYRSYAPEDVVRLRFIKRTRDLGFRLEEVRALLDISVQQDRDCCEIDALATEHLAEVDRKIADLTSLRQQLSSMIASCRGGTVADCQILEAFQHE